MNTSILIDIWSGIAALLLIHWVYTKWVIPRDAVAREKIAPRIMTYVYVHFCGFIISLGVILLYDVHVLRYYWLAIPGLVGIPVALWLSRKMPIKIVYLLMLVDKYYSHSEIKEMDLPTIPKHRILQNILNGFFIIGFFMIAIFYGLAIALLFRN